MPWTGLLLVTSLLFGVNYGNSAIDIHLRQLYKQQQQQEQHHHHHHQQQQQEQQHHSQHHQHHQHQSHHQYQQQEQEQKLDFLEDEGFNALSDLTSGSSTSSISSHSSKSETLNLLDMVTNCNEHNILSMEMTADCLNAFNAAMDMSSSNGDDYGDIESSNEQITEINNPLESTTVKLRNSLNKDDDRNMIFIMQSSSIGIGMGMRMDNDVATLLPPLPIFMPSMYYSEFYEDLLPDVKSLDIKRSKGSVSCDCKVTNDLLDLGQQHFPRYLLNAVCEARNKATEMDTKCWHGAICKPLEYKVKVLQFRIESLRRDPALVWLPDDLRHLWKFKTVTVTAGCFCGH